jgi:hypothetical protein
MNRRTTLTLATITLLGLAVATALPQAGLAQSDPLIGTWKINLAKSKYTPGPAPRSGTTTFEAVGQGLRITAEGIDAQGKPTKLDFGVTFTDGKSYPITGSPDYDAASYSRVNSSTMDSTRTKAGKAVQTTSSVISADGKTRTLTTTGVNANGQQINNVAFYEKQ